MHGRTTFSYRGKQRDAQVRPNNCDIKPFSLGRTQYRQHQGLTFRLQPKTTLVEYEDTQSEIQQQFHGVRTRTVDGKLQTQSAAQYLRAIHP
ncbi:hypothetical protein JG688_00013570 [Phytophthora aleatoria]|uniref:Uncharacterized protein n=1 Tax=Phytophthora aleatoria TaxID=2496075 RepID=A0A8J5LYG0_9STRA|nr:hypothetical protein JG688_00013570 [Phytophthora aleatoria]